MSARHVVLVLAIVAVTLVSLGFGALGPATNPHASRLGEALTVTSGGASATSTPTVHLGPHAAFAQKVLSLAKADHIPMAAVSLPNFMGQARVANGVVSPLTTIAPAPMGIGTFGVENTTGTPTAYNISTSSWEGSITINNVNSFLLTNDGALSTAGSNNTFGVQLNAVTANTTVGSVSNGSFWAQNVFYWNLVPGSITFLDNVWNFSSPATSLTSGTIYSGNGTPVYPTFYFDFGPTVPVSLPVTVHLFVNSSTTNLISTGFGYTTIRFGYDVVNATTNVSEANGVYDTVLFNSTVPIGSVPTSPFLVDGSQLTPTNFLLYDAEIMIGGPGGGTTTSIYGINATEQLQYWDATAGTYLNPPSAWNVGTDTGETSEGIAESYTTPGTVQVTAGPSIPAPLWNATPGGNLGRSTISATLTPSNGFVFVSPGTVLDPNDAAWAPTQTSSHLSYVVPPGTYTVEAMMSDYAPKTVTVTVANGGSTSLNFALVRNPSLGVYTPLDAWNNGQLAAISSSGTGTAAHPYQIVNNAAHGGLNPVFGEFNDFLFPVFPGVLIAGTTAHVDLTNPSLMGFTYPSGVAAGLARLGLPSTNNLMFEIFDASNVSIWNANGITGWFFFQDIGPTGLLPLANVVIWGGTHDLVGRSTFYSQGSALVLAGSDPFAPTGNVVWGNRFLNSSVLSPTMYPGNGAVNGPPIGIFAFEAGDLIYNNYIVTSITAYAPDQNMFYGFGQLNLENWNLSEVEPAGQANVFNGHVLVGTIVHSTWQGGNYWGDYVSGSGLPYDEFGFIQSGGDFFPLPITAYTVVFTLHGTGGPVAWSVTLNGVTESTTLPYLVFYEVPGNYTYAATIASGTISPASGTVSVVNHAVTVGLTRS